MLQLHGEWHEALEAAVAAERRSEEGENQASAARACYLQGEVRRLRGELDTAEAAYRDASRLGLEPQPGFALMRLAQGRQDAAASAISRALAEATERLTRAALLPAFAEIMVATDEVERAGEACAELAVLADRGDDLAGDERVVAVERAAALLASPVLTGTRERQRRGPRRSGDHAADWPGEAHVEQSTSG